MMVEDEDEDEKDAVLDDVYVLFTAQNVAQVLKVPFLIRKLMDIAPRIAF